MPQYVLCREQSNVTGCCARFIFGGYLLECTLHIVLVKEMSVYVIFITQ